MSAAVIGGVVLLIVVVLVFLLMGKGEEDATVVPAPTQSQATEYKADEVPKPEVGGENVPELEEEEPTVEVEVPADEVLLDDPTKIEGCVGWFTGESFDEDNQVWKDKSGKGHDCTEILGAIFKTEDDKNRTYIQGSKEDGLKFPKECMTNNKKHTFFSVAKYISNNADDNHRIFDGVDANYLVGFHHYGPCHGIYGSAHRDGNGWIGHWECAVNNMDQNGNFNWILHTDQKSLLRVNGARKTSLTSLGEQRTSQMTINWGMGRGWGQTSKWAVGECIFYNRELSEEEMTKVELMLHKKWGIPRRVRAPQWMHNNPWSRYWNDTTNAFTNEYAFKTLSRFGNHCGDTGLNSASRIVQHHYYDSSSNTWKPNGNWGIDGGCISNASAGAGAQKKTQWVSTADTTSWQDRLSKALSIDCGKNGLQNWDFELTPDKSQIRVNYQCSSDQLDTPSCTKTFRVAQQNGIEGIDIATSLHDVTGGCDGLKATNKLKWTKDADGRWGYEATCCAIADV